MFTLKWTNEAQAEYEQLKQAAERILAERKRTGKKKKSKQEGFFRQVHKTIELLKQNPQRPGLRTHPFSSLSHPYSKKEKVFEAYAQNNTPGACRVFWCYGPNKGMITVVAITPHP